MTQFQYSGPNPMSGTRRSPVIDLPRTGRTASLAAPGLAAGVVDDRGAVMARQILNIIGGAGEVVSTIGRNQQIRDREQLQIAKEAEREAKEVERESKYEARIRDQELKAVEAADIGTGRELADDNELGFNNRILNGQIPFDKPEDAAEAWRLLGVEMNLNENQMRGWMSRRNRFVETAYTKMNRTVAESQNALIDNYRAAVISGELAPEQAKVVAGFVLTKDGVTDQNAIDRFMLETARDASIEGKKELVNSTLNQLSSKDKYTSEIEKVNINLTQFDNKQKQQINDRAIKQFSTLVYNEVPTSQMRDFIESQRKEGVDPTLIVTWARNTDEIDNRRQREVVERKDEEFKQNFNASVVSKYYNDSVVGNARTIEDAVIELPSGKSYSVSANQIEESISRMAQDNIRQLYPNDPNRQMTEYVKWATTNGIQPKDITAMMKRGAATINAETQQLSPLGAEGYRSYKLLSNFSPTFIHSLPIGDEKALRTYQIANEFEKLGIYGSEVESLRQATKYIEDRGIPNVPMETRSLIVKQVAQKIGVSPTDSSIAMDIDKNINLMMAVTKDPNQTINILANRLNGRFVKDGDRTTILDARLNDSARANMVGIREIVANNYLSGKMNDVGPSQMKIEFGDKTADNFYLQSDPGGYLLIDREIGLPVSGMPISFSEINRLAPIAERNSMRKFVEKAESERRIAEEAQKQRVPAGVRENF